MPSSSMSSQAGQFGPNEWLVEEMYQRFLDDPTAVDPAWHDFFADYRPGDGDAAPDGQRHGGDRGGVRRRPSLRSPARREGRHARRPPRAKVTHGPDPPGERCCARRRTRPARAGEARRGQRLEGRAPGAGGRGGHDDAVARCRVDGREEHGGVAGGADGDVGAGGAGEAAGRQPPGDQQPAAADARRQDLLHPPHRVRRRAGAGRVPGDEPALHRDRRPPDGGHPGPRQPRPGDRPARQGRRSGRWSWCRSRAARR